MSVNIVDSIISLTRENNINWQNYKDTHPKRTLTNTDYRRLMAATKYPKRVMPVRDGYNKYQSYYAFHNDLVICLTKGKRDSRLILIVGNVTPTNTKYYDTELTVFTNESCSDKLDVLFELIHLPYSNYSTNDLNLGDIKQQLIS